ncbi:MAG: DUF3054 domain-containing protein [Anaerolineales bacterium]|nr:DUF3054 domain-containing protein [Anaerolineales bacterium]
MNKKQTLMLGDAIAIAILTYIGFTFHNQTEISSRMATTFFPMLLGWFLLAPWFGLFDENIISNQKLLLRVPLAMLFVAPLASILRSASLESAALPIFTFILGFTNAIGMLAWRWIYYKLSNRNK